MATRKQKQRRHLVDQAIQKQEISGPLARLVEEQVEEQVKIILPSIISSIDVSHEQQTVHIGPLPPPEDAAKYESLCPGFVDRTLAITENAQKADVSTIKRIQWFQFTHAMAALVFAAGIIVASLYWSYQMLKLDESWFKSITPLLGGLTTLIAAFFGSKSLTKKPKDKDKPTNKPVKK